MHRSLRDIGDEVRENWQDDSGHDWAFWWSCGFGGHKPAWGVQCQTHCRKLGIPWGERQYPDQERVARLLGEI